jgi:Ca2+-binding EF-hand superfamily protein
MAGSLTEDQLVHLQQYIERYFEDGDEATLRQAFDIFDLDHSRTLTMNELKDVTRRVQNGPLSRDERRRMAEHFLESDTNGDRVLDFEEFIGYVVSMKQS